MPTSASPHLTIAHDDDEDEEKTRSRAGEPRKRWAVLRTMTRREPAAAVLEVVLTAGEAASPSFDETGTRHSQQQDNRQRNHVATSKCSRGNLAVSSSSHERGREASHTNAHWMTMPRQTAFPLTGKPAKGPYSQSGWQELTHHRVEQPMPPCNHHPSHRHLSCCAPRSALRPSSCFGE